MTGATDLLDQNRNFDWSGIDNFLSTGIITSNRPEQHKSVCKRMKRLLFAKLDVGVE